MILHVLAFTALALLLTRLVTNWLRLRNVPGPLLAGFSDYWRAYYQYRGKLRRVLTEAHKRYGPIVRYGVNSVSINDATAVTSIYESRTGFITADSYSVLIGISNGKEVPSLVSTADEAKHNALRKSVASAFTPSGVLDLEPYIDQTLPEFQEALMREGTFDLAWWSLLYSMDTSSRMLFSESLGFLTSGQDVGGTIAVIRGRFNHWGWWSSLPGLERLVYRNPIALRSKRAPSAMAALSAKKLKERLSDADEAQHNDLLQKFIEASRAHPETLDTAGIVGMLMSSISGAGDTTATSLTAVVYYILRNPDVKGKLLVELREAKVPVYPAYAQVSKLPYLHAVIKEGMRLCSSATWPIERTVPAGGATLAGKYFPEGTSVGCLPSVIHQDPIVFGDEPDQFRPERWLEASEERSRLMERAWLGFGKGKRVCLGQHIAIMQMKKIIPMLLQSFELSLVYDDQVLDADTSAAVVALRPVWMQINNS